MDGWTDGLTHTDPLLRCLTHVKMLEAMGAMILGASNDEMSRAAIHGKLCNHDHVFFIKFAYFLVILINLSSNPFYKNKAGCKAEIIASH